MKGSRRPGKIGEHLFNGLGTSESTNVVINHGEPSSVGAPLLVPDPSEQARHLHRTTCISPEALAQNQRQDLGRDISGPGSSPCRACLTRPGPTSIAYEHRWADLVHKACLRRPSTTTIDLPSVPQRSMANRAGSRDSYWVKEPVLREGDLGQHPGPLSIDTKRQDIWDLGMFRFQFESLPRSPSPEI